MNTRATVLHETATGILSGCACARASSLDLLLLISP